MKLKPPRQNCIRHIVPIYFRPSILIPLGCNGNIPKYYTVLNGLVLVNFGQQIILCVLIESAFVLQRTLSARINICVCPYMYN